MKKLFDLPEESVKILDSIKEERGFKTDVETLKYVLAEYANQKNNPGINASEIAEATKAALQSDLSIITEASREAERWSFAIANAVNRIVLRQKYYTDDEDLEHPVAGDAEWIDEIQCYSHISNIYYRQADRKLKEIRSSRKQQADNEKLKRGE